jgi:diguanylate cyclase (GGDEF)-like protein
VTSWINNISRMLKRVADNHHMSLLAARLEDIYMKDELTGLYNYRGFRAMASMIVDDMIVTGAPLLMISFDIEHLKDINKDWGHEEGDFALQVFSSALKTTLEEDVILARTGDDEFSVLLPGLEKADAKEYISHICQ